mgnify:CR=1 FL=1
MPAGILSEVLEAAAFNHFIDSPPLVKYRNPPVDLDVDGGISLFRLARSMRIAAYRVGLFLF